MSTQSVVNQDSYSKGTFKSPGVPASNNQGIRKAAQYRIKAKAASNTPVGKNKNDNHVKPVSANQKTQGDSLRKEARGIS